MDRCDDSMSNADNTNQLSKEKLSNSLGKTNPASFVLNHFGLVSKSDGAMPVAEPRFIAHAGIDGLKVATEFFALIATLVGLKQRIFILVPVAEDP